MLARLYWLNLLLSTRVALYVRFLSPRSFYVLHRPATILHRRKHHREVQETGTSVTYSWSKAADRYRWIRVGNPEPVRHRSQWYNTALISWTLVDGAKNWRGPSYELICLNMSKITYVTWSPDSIFSVVMDKISDMMVPASR